MSDQRARRERAARKMPGVRTLGRPASDQVPAFDLGYVRTGPRTATPILVIPGGPGLGSVLPYGAVRKRGARMGLDLLMVEHRGVGLSRRTVDGDDVPPSAVSIRSAADDLVAAMDAEGVERAIVYGSSYGSYLAQALGVWHPERVAGIVLDSPIISAGDHVVVREHARAVLWNGETPATATLARRLRALVAAGLADQEEASAVARMVYEFAGPKALSRLLDAYAAGRASRTWRRVAGMGRRETEQVLPLVMEFDLVGRIAVGELNYASDPDGGPFDPGAGFRGLRERFGTFTGEPLDLPAEHAGFGWPVVVVSGERDLRTPRPIAERIVAAVPDGTLVGLPATGHSALDTHPVAALTVAAALRDGTHVTLAGDRARLASLRRVGLVRHASTVLRMSLAVERLLPRAAGARESSLL